MLTPPGRRVLRLALRYSGQLVNKLAWAALNERWRRAELARLERVRQATPKIVFLCFGNINRSPYAAALLSQRLPGRSIESAGLYERDGRVAAAPAFRAAAAIGLDLSSHRSRRLTTVDVPSTLYVVFERYQAWELYLRFGRSIQVLHLGSLAADSGEPIDIADPYETSALEANRIFGRIRASVDELSHRLSLHVG